MYDARKQPDSNKQTELQNQNNQMVELGHVRELRYQIAPLRHRLNC